MTTKKELNSLEENSSTNTFQYRRKKRKKIVNNFACSRTTYIQKPFKTYL